MNKKNKKDFKILVTENEGDLRENLVRQIKNLGYSVDSSENGRLGLEKVLVDEFHLIISAIEMPEMNGIKLYDAVEKEKKHSHIPFIFIGDYGERKNIFEEKNRRVDDFLPENFDEELLEKRISPFFYKKHLHNQEKIYLKKIESEKIRSDKLLSKTLSYAIAIFSEKVFDRLLENMLEESMEFCNADAGTLYLRTPNDHLEFNIVRTTSLGLALGGTRGEKISFNPIPMRHKESGEPNHNNVVSHVALTGSLANIPDAYATDEFDFSGTKKFDKQNKYLSRSFLTIPLVSTEKKVIGVLQLINSVCLETKEIVSFTKKQERQIESLSRLAAVALESYVREQGLKKKISELRVIIDQTKRDERVDEITSTDYFQNLIERADSLRKDA